MIEKITVLLLAALFLCSCKGNSSSESTSILTDPLLLSCLDGIESEEKLEELEDFSCFDIDLSKADIKQLANLPKLKTLTLNRTNITSLDFFNLIDGLEYLDLKDNYDRSLRNAVSLNLESITSNEGLKALDISGNFISDISPLSKLRNLEVLKINSNTVYGSESTYTNLSNYIYPLNSYDGRRNNWIEFIPNDSFPRGLDLTPLAGLDKLSVLELSENNYHWDFNLLTSLRNIQEISSLTELIKIDLGGSFVNERELFWLPSMSKLKHLDLSGNIYRLYESSLTTMKDFNFLKEMPGLEYLDLSANIPSNNNDIRFYNDFQIDAKVISHMNKLKYLNISHNAYLVNVDYLSNLVNLSELHLKDMQSDLLKYEKNNTLQQIFEVADYSKVVSSLPKLLEVDISSNLVEEFLFSGNRSLKKLNARNNLIKNISIFNTLDGLEELDIRENCIDNINDLSIDAKLINDGLPQKSCD